MAFFLLFTSNIYFPNYLSFYTGHKSLEHWILPNFVYLSKVQYQVDALLISRFHFYAFDFIWMTFIWKIKSKRHQEDEYNICLFEIFCLFRERVRIKWENETFWESSTCPFSFYLSLSHSLTHTLEFYLWIFICWCECGSNRFNAPSSKSWM